jgi:GSH-dependent disulfide-bond oxidoreductase
MIDFYTWKTPNGQKIAIMLEELQLPYQPHFIDLTKQEQYHPDFLRINPNNKIPVIVDSDGPNHHPLTLSESGAILIYLAEKTGKFLSVDARQRIETIQWLMFQMAGVGPMLGQLNHFLHAAAERIPYAIERYTNEARRIYRVMEERLEKHPYFAGDYSIADIAMFPWINRHARQHIDLEDYPHIKHWHASIANRPAVIKAMALI